MLRSYMAASKGFDTKVRMTSWTRPLGPDLNRWLMSSRLYPGRSSVVTDTKQWINEVVKEKVKFLSHHEGGGYVPASVEHDGKRTSSWEQSKVPGKLESLVIRQAQRRSNF
jgi:hypothetical protein